MVDLPRIALATGPKILRDIDRPSSAISRPASATTACSSTAAAVPTPAPSSVGQQKPKGRMPVGLKEDMQERARKVAALDTKAVMFVEMMRKPTNPSMRVEYTRSLAFFDYFSKAL